MDDTNASALAWGAEFQGRENGEDRGGKQESERANKREATPHCLIGVAGRHVHVFGHCVHQARAFNDGPRIGSDL